MAAGLRVKICGLTTSADIPAALLAGADYLGFVFYPPSPRNLGVADAGFMAGTVPEGIAKVALTVDADNDTLDSIVAAVAPDMLQLHGSETVFRVAELRKRYGVAVMKAVGIADADDLGSLDDFESVADQLLVDARAPEEAALPGGSGRRFDWRLLAGRRWRVPWMLAGGLTAGNVAEAVRQTGARQVDVSSGVESAPGEKDGARMAEFVRAAEAAECPTT